MALVRPQRRGDAIWGDTIRAVAPALITRAKTLFSLDMGVESLFGLSFLLIPPFLWAPHVCVDHRVMEASQARRDKSRQNPAC
ncbi:hypothetical protein AEAC466_01660 [Asticcacaulis sp. AC466]|nr:hypothetical protein AEAC466_01660 [Asticcacaulis sp. AC466]